MWQSKPFQLFPFLCRRVGTVASNRSRLWFEFDVSKQTSITPTQKTLVVSRKTRQIVACKQRLLELRNIVESSKRVVQTVVFAASNARTSDSLNFQFIGTFFILTNQNNATARDIRFAWFGLDCIDSFLFHNSVFFDKRLDIRVFLSKLLKILFDCLSNQRHLVVCF